MNKVTVGKTVYDIVSMEEINGKKAYGLKSGNTVKTLCESNSMTGWALWGFDSARRPTMTCPNKVVFH